MDPLLKEMIKTFPNDQELGSAIRAYVLNGEDCCSKKENQIDASHPVLSGTQCNKCGKVTYNWEEV